MGKGVAVARKYSAFFGFKRCGANIEYCPTLKRETSIKKKERKKLQIVQNRAGGLVLHFLFSDMNRKLS